MSDSGRLPTMSSTTSYCFPGATKSSAGVVDDLVRADRPDELDVPRAAHAGHVARRTTFAICTANVPTPPDGAVDQHPLPRLEMRLVAQPLQRGASCDRDGAGLLEREVRRLREEVLPADDVFGERAAAGCRRSRRRA